MPTPDFFLSRRQLRRSRLQDALGMPRAGVNVDLHRNRLLEQLAEAADNPVSEFDSLPSTTVDTVVSLALSEIDEKATDALLVVLICIRILACDGQFARLNVLADRLNSISRRLSVERPYLEVATGAFALVLRSRESGATSLLNERLGISRQAIPASVAADREQLNDILMAVTLRNLIVNQDRSFADRATEIAVNIQDGLLFVFLEAMLSWYDAAVKARPYEVLAEVDKTFDVDSLKHYLSLRKIEVLYPAQIKAIRGGVTLDQNHVVSLPTSSGKTLIAELRIAAALTRHPGARAIYIAPYRMLSRQVTRTFQRGLAPLNITVRDLGSGFDPNLIVGSDGLPDVAICTPERLDALLRMTSTATLAGTEVAELFASANLIVFDELQLIGRPGRGPRFEMILARMRAKYPNMLFLGLCAATQGADALARWLTGNDAITGASRPTGTLEIVWETNGKLMQRVEPRPTAVAELPRTQAGDDAAQLILRLNPRYRPVLAVEPSRQLAESLARKITQRGAAIAGEWRDSLSPPQLNRLSVAVEEVKSLLGDGHQLARCMENGIAFHHAGVPIQALQLIEQLASERLLRVVCATTTVAEGADLPFRVVVLPHLNFPGRSRRLERDLYLNIVGRAGRANVSVEGLVFILDSDAATLKNVVRASLWSNTTADRIRSRLSEVGTTLASIEDWDAYYYIQSQVMGWLGDGASYTDDQAQQLGSSTLGWHEGTVGDRQLISHLITDTLEDLEARGYALAASPYQLTSLGQTARLTGLSAPTVARLESALTRSRDGWLADIADIQTLTPAVASQIARLTFESIEVVENSLWLRRVASNEQAKLAALASFAAGEDRAFYASDEYASDIELLSSWLLGMSYADIASVAPIYRRANSLFGGTDEAKRTSDAAEYIGKLTYPASWVWSGFRILAGAPGEGFPGFIRDSIEFGLPSESATQLVYFARLTRGGAVAISEITGPAWNSAREWIAGVTDDEIRQLGLTTLDISRVIELKERIVLSRESE